MISAERWHMRVSDFVLVAAAAAAFLMAESSHNHAEIAPSQPVNAGHKEAQLITCPLRKPEFATVMQAALLGDGTLLVEQQTRTRVAHIKDC
ncbi:hypothetical protein MKI84_18460 [Ancylobacter sp. A5.8]|uniref:hypothetical protein n=1 Tax=Ancylobacter gelatini TaxID=2919920 RepID=UPI001F4E7A82|nr:hypothetical protein [Ancylobacter gelatini]MCJ8144909.1 hypothetical protein [Ancylobacter gelatini]